MRWQKMVSLTFGVFALSCARPESISSIRRGCVAALSCTPTVLGTPTRAGICFSEIAPSVALGARPERQYQLRCAREATSCSTLRACITRNHNSDYCAAHHHDSCDGNVRVKCPLVEPNTPDELAQPATTQDCTLAGLTCTAVNGSAVCGDGMACDRTFVDTCDGTKVVRCDLATGTRVSTDCARVLAGGTCIMAWATGAMFPRCASSTVCTRDPNRSPTRCESNSLISCVVVSDPMPDPLGRIEGREVRLDCAHEVLEGRCTTLGGVASCTSVQNQCGPTSPDRCNGNAVEICVNGRYESTDCGSLGFARCAQLTFTTAACVN